MELSPRQLDRAIGALVGTAAGDALGVPYEFGTATLGERAEMVGGGLGGLAPGQWSDDTEMAVCLARVAATGVDLRAPEALEAIAQAFLGWYADDPPDVGVQTRQLLAQVEPGAPAVPQLRRLGADLHDRTGRTAGNGSLMRTAPVALAHLGDPDAVEAAARAISGLTHHDPMAGDACVLWSLAIEHAVLTGTRDVRVGLDRVDPSWAGLLEEAERHDPAHFAARNGWVVAALQAAWSAARRAFTWEDGVQAAIRGGNDTDTVAAITGALLGASHGAGAVPAAYRSAVHGWPGMRLPDLVDLVERSTRSTWPASLLPSSAVCPIDGAPAPEAQRYPFPLCWACVGRATDLEGHPVGLFNVSITGGFQGLHRADDSPCEQVTRGHQVLVDGVVCHADEARFGGVVVQPEELLALWHPPQR